MRLRNVTDYGNYLRWASRQGSLNFKLASRAAFEHVLEYARAGGEDRERGGGSQAAPLPLPPEP